MKKISGKKRIFFFEKRTDLEERYREVRTCRGGDEGMVPRGFVKSRRWRGSRRREGQAETKTQIVLFNHGVVLLYEMWER